MKPFFYLVALTLLIFSFHVHTVFDDIVDSLVLVLFNEPCVSPFCCELYIMYCKCIVCQHFDCNCLSAVTKTEEQTFTAWIYYVLSYILL